MRSTKWASVVVTFIALGSASPANGLPSFARKHGMECSQCHTIYPKLTPLGRRFKENGFRLPDDDTSWQELLRSFPGSMRARFLSDLSSDELGPEIGTFQPVAAGSASSWISFRVDWPFTVSREALEELQREHYWVRVNDVLRFLRPGLVHIKAGQFELDLPFTQSRTYNLSLYAPYSLSGAYEESLAAPRRGLELSGSLGGGFRYSLAVADTLGIPSFQDDTFISVVEDPFDLDLYFRVSKTFRNDNRLGFFLYRADNIRTQRIIDKIDIGPFPFDFEVTSRNDPKLLGVDLDWLSGNQRFNAYGLFILGRRDLASKPFMEFQGGFAQLDTRVVSSMTLVARYSWTRTFNKLRSLSEPPGLFRPRRKQDLMVGCQWLVTERLKIALEYRVLDENRFLPRAAFAVDFVL